MTKTTTTKLQTVNRKQKTFCCSRWNWPSQARPGPDLGLGLAKTRRSRAQKPVIDLRKISCDANAHTLAHMHTNTHMYLCELEIRKTFNEARAKRLKLVFCYLALIIGSTSNNNSNNKQQKQVIPVRVSICNKDWCRCADANSDATWVVAAAVEIGKSWRDPWVIWSFRNTYYILHISYIVYTYV